MGFSERHLGQILSGSGTRSRGEEKRYEFSRHRGSARERLLLDQGRWSAIEGEKCVFERDLVRASCPPRFVRESFVTGIVMAR